MQQFIATFLCLTLVILCEAFQSSFRKPPIIRRVWSLVKLNTPLSFVNTLQSTKAHASDTSAVNFRGGGRSKGHSTRFVHPQVGLRTQTRLSPQIIFIPPNYIGFKNVPTCPRADATWG